MNLKSTVYLLTLALFLSFMISYTWARSPLEFQVMDDESYGESLTSIVTTPNGAYLLVQGLLTNAGLGDEKGACRILWVPASNTDKTNKGINAVNRDDQDWSWSANQKKITLSTCQFIDQGTQLLIKAKAKQLKVELAFQGSLKSISPPNSQLKLDDDQSFKAMIVIPWAKVQGTVRAKSKTYKIEGVGYLDHSQSNVMMTDLAQHWLRFRGLIKDPKSNQSKRTLIQMRVDPKGKRWGWIWQEGQAKPQPLSSKTLKAFKVKQLKANKSISFTFKSYPLKLNLGRKIYTYEPVRAYGMLGRLASSWIGDPLVRTYQATLELEKGQIIKGVVEHAWIRK